MICGKCILWEGGRGGSDQQYGILRVSGRRIYAHRDAYEKTKGPIPDGMTIDHLCRNKLCVNPDHLDVCTRRENSRRAAAQDGKKLCPHGKRTERVGNGSGNCRECRKQYLREYNRKRYAEDPEFRRRAKERSVESRRRRRLEDPEFRRKEAKRMREYRRRRRAETS